MSKAKIVWLCILGFFLIFVIWFIFELVGLGFFKFFEPKRENVRRDVFENTQSYVHGKTQDLAKYYDEWMEADESDKEAIRKLIIMRFAELDAEKIQSLPLRQFLIKMRRY